MAERLIGATIAVIQRIRKIFAIFEPNTFPIAISVFPEIDASKETISSGILVPIATIVSPITASEIFHFFAREIEPSTRRFPPTVRRISQASRKKMERSIEERKKFFDYSENTCFQNLDFETYVNFIRIR